MHTHYPACYLNSLKFATWFPAIGFWELLGEGLIDRALKSGPSLLSFMGKITTSATQPVSQEASNYDEVFMQQSLLFDDSLKDLKNLRTQLYSAAEYFELSYTNDDQKQIVVETLKDYAIKALVNTVDHLGSVTYKVNDLLDEKVVEVSVSELRVSCIEQRIKTCQEYMDHEGRTQQSLVISTPKYPKRYILPVGETMHGANVTKSKYVGYNLDDEDDWPHFRNAVRATIRETPPSTARRGRSHHLLYNLRDLELFRSLQPCLKRI
ncbi:ABIL3 protein [Spatholobus suberectus]|nr:ABIL3 protein [Spatholobus suberectus]